MTVEKMRDQPQNGQLHESLPASKLPQITPKLAGRIRRIITWASLSSAMMLLTLAAFAQLVMLLDPYQRAARNVAAVLESQPSVEQNLTTIHTASAALSDHLALYAAEGIIRTSDQTQEDDAVAAFVERGIRSRDAVAFTGLMESLASEIVSLAQAMQQEFLPINLAPLLAQARREAGGSSATLNQIYEQIPAALEQINNQRMRMQTVANSAYVIFETPQFQPIIKILEDEYPPPDAPVEAATPYYAAAIRAWAELLPLCESLEIQFAGYAIVLGDIYAAVRDARQLADRWGYFEVERAVKWINQRIAVILMSCVAFLLMSFAVLLWEGRIHLRLPRLDSLNWLRSLADQLRGNPFPKLLQIIAYQLDQFINSMTARLTAVKQPRRALQPHPAEAALQVIQTGLPKAVKRLSREHPLRIGGDPLDTIYIPSVRPGEIDVWIRPARVGYFVEVISSEAPVLLNGQPISGARRLTNGDAIQIHDTLLLFQER